VGKRDVTNKSDGAIEYNPTKKKVLPKPKESTPTSRKVVFSRPSEEIKLLALEFFDREDENAGIVGDKCFTIVLNKLNKKLGDRQ